MRFQIKKIYFVLILQAILGTVCAEENYFNAFGGRGAHNQESMEDSKTRPFGLAYGAGIGKRFDFYEFELNVSKGNYSTEIEHDGVKNKLLNEQIQYSLGFNFYLVKTIYFRLGYAVTDLKQSPETPVSGASGDGLTNAYGLKEDKFDGVLFGGGWVFAPFKSARIYLQYEYFSLPQIKATQHLMSIGLRCYLF